MRLTGTRLTRRPVNLKLVGLLLSGLWEQYSSCVATWLRGVLTGGNGRTWPGRVRFCPTNACLAPVNRLGGAEVRPPPQWYNVHACWGVAKRKDSGLWSHYSEGRVIPPQPPVFTRFLICYPSYSTSHAVTPTAS